MRYLTRAHRRWLGGIALSVFITVLLPALIPACSQHDDTRLAKIKSAGELVVLTRSSPSTYVETSDGPIGFEHDLAQAFAHSLGVRARFVVADRHASILPDLENGDADMAAAGITITDDIAGRFLFSPPYQETRQQVVFRLGTTPPGGVTDLIGRQIEVHRDTPQAARLRELQAKHADLKWTEVNDRETEQLLESVWDGFLEITVANSHIIALNRQFFPELQVAFDLAPPQALVWAFPLSEDRSLYDTAVKFLAQYRAAGELGHLLDRYYGPANRASFINTTVYHARIRDRLPLYRNLFKQAGKVVNLDWRLLAAMAYQESYWDHTAVSPTGVRGMMMLTEDTAREVGVLDPFNAEQSILGGARYLRDLYERLDHIPLPDRVWFALAAYNIGFSHLEDARILTQRQGKDPRRWNDVKEHLPLLEQPAWYNRTRFGFARGSEAVQLVNRVRTYYDVLVKIDEEERAKDRTDALKLKMPAI